MNKYAIFFAATGPLVGRNYLADVNCLLNSIEKHQLHRRIGLDVWIINCGFDPAWNYVERAQETFSFNLISCPIHQDEIHKHHKAIEYVKRIRYKILTEEAREYSAVCLLDADMFIVSDEITNLFKMVAGTEMLIGCNEKFKWDVGPESYYEKTGAPIFTHPQKLHSMICNVPSIFDMKEWIDVFRYYNDIAFNGYQYKNGCRVGIGDIFAHNIAIHKKKRDCDVVMFPMETMAQVHHTWINPNTYVVNDNGRWRSAAGDKIYMIHDTKRICKINFVKDNMNKFMSECKGASHLLKFEGKIRDGLQQVQQEWWKLNYEGVLKIDEFIDIDEQFYNKKRGNYA